MNAISLEQHTLNEIQQDFQENTTQFQFFKIHFFFPGSIQYFKAVAHIVNCKVELLHGLQQNPRDTEGGRRINHDILASFIRSPV